MWYNGRKFLMRGQYDMKKWLMVILCGAMLTGCGSKQSIEDGINTAQTQEPTRDVAEIEEKSENISGFEKADYERFNSYASENGLDGTLIYVDCTIDSMIEVNGVVALLLNDSGNEENKWILSFSEPTYMIEEQVDNVIGKEVRVFGEYIGKSKLLQMPALTIVDQDSNYYIELDDETELTFMDFVDIYGYMSGSEHLAVDENIYDVDALVEKSLYDITYMIPERWESTLKESGGYTYYYDNSMLVSIAVDKTDININELDESGKLEGLESLINGTISVVDSFDEISRNIVDFKTTTMFCYDANITLENEKYYMQTNAFIFNENFYSFSILVGQNSAKNYKNEFNSLIESIEFDSDDADPEQPDTTLIDEVEIESVVESEMIEYSNSGGEVTTGKKNALRSAQSYLDVMPFSHSGLIEQLEYDGYTKEEATYAADNCGADWNEQAAESAKNYLDIMAFSRNGLIEQLEYDGYTHEQAVYGAEQNGY